MFCENCGAKLPDDEAICSKCGAVVSEFKSNSITDEERDALLSNSKGKKVKKSNKKMNRKQLLILVGLICLVVISSSMSIILLFGSKKPIGYDMPYFYESNGDMYVLFNGATKGTKIVQDYYDDYCDFVVVDEETFIVLEDEQLYIHKGKKKRTLIMDHVTDFLPSESGEKIVIVQADNSVYLYDGKETVLIVDHVTNNDFVFSNDESQVGFSSFANNEKLFYLFNGKTLEKINLDKNYVFESFQYIVGKNLYFSAIGGEGEIVLVRVKGTKTEELFKYHEIYWESKYREALVYYENDIYHFNGKDTTKILNNIQEVITFDDEYKKLLFKEDNQLNIYRMGDDDAYTIENSENVIDDSAIRIGKRGYIIYFSTGDEVVVYTENKQEGLSETYDIDHIKYVKMSNDGEQALLYGSNNKLYLFTQEEGHKELASNVSRSDLGPVFNLKGNKYIYITANKELTMLDNNGNATIIDDNIRKVYNQNDYYIYYVDENDDLYGYKLGDKKSKKIKITYDAFYGSQMFSDKN